MADKNTETNNAEAAPAKGAEIIGFVETPITGYDQNTGAFHD
jgi:hypothetical protein